MIRHTACGLALLGAGLVTTPAQAGDPWYVALGAASLRVNDSEQRIANAPAPGSTLHARNRYDHGTDAVLALGRHLGRFRAEVEYARGDNDTRRFTVSAPFTATLRQDGRVELARWMLNGYVDLGRADAPLRPYLGAGLGTARVSLRRVAGVANNPAAPPFKHLDDSDRGLAWQAVAGLAWQATARVALTAEYRYLDAGDWRGRDTRGQAVSTRTAASGVGLGLRLDF